MDEFKVNRKCIRLTDKVCGYVEKYRGDSFNVKFENMVLDFQEKSDDLRNEWNMLQAAVADKHQELMRIQEKLRKVRMVEARFGPLVDALTQLLPKA